MNHVQKAKKIHKLTSEKPVCGKEFARAADAPLNKKYFTSNDPHHGIYTFSYWQIFWHSI